MRDIDKCRDRKVGFRHLRNYIESGAGEFDDSERELLLLAIDRAILTENRNIAMARYGE